MKIVFTLLLSVLTICNSSLRDSSRQEAKPLGESQEAANKEEDHLATIISQNGKIVLEKYSNGKSKESLCNVQSLTKGLISILIGIAIDREFIKGVDTPISLYFPDEFEKFINVRKQQITIRHILNQTSGLSWKGYLEHKDWLESSSPVSYVLEKGLEHEPGVHYNYHSGATHLLSVILSKATGQSTLDFANKYLFSSLHIQRVEWELRGGGFHDGSGLGLSMTPMDLMKIGQLLVEQGSWEGEQVLSESWIDQSFDLEEKSNTSWGIRWSKHGFCWYKAKFQGQIVNYGMGYGGQFILTFTEKDLVIIALHNHDTPKGIDNQIHFLTQELPVLLEKYGHQEIEPLFSN